MKIIFGFGITVCSDVVILQRNMAFDGLFKNDLYDVLTIRGYIENHLLQFRNW